MNPPSTQAKLDSIQQLQTRLSAALEHNCYLGEEFLAKLSMDIEAQLQELAVMLEKPASSRYRSPTAELSCPGTCAGQHS